MPSPTRINFFSSWSSKFVGHLLNHIITILYYIIFLILSQNTELVYLFTLRSFLPLCSVSEESLEDYLSLHEHIREPLAAKYILKIMEGLQYLHDSKIIHANLSVNT